MTQMQRQQLKLRLACDEIAPAAVRSALKQHGWVTGDVLLVASELVTNAVLHSGAEEGDELEIDIRVELGSLRIAVADPGRSGISAAASSGRSAHGGLGLRLVDQLTTGWGVERLGDGRQRVHAETPLPAVGGRRVFDSRGVGSETLRLA